MANGKKNKITLLLQPAIGDWTVYKPDHHRAKEDSPVIRGPAKLADSERYSALLLFLNFSESFASSLNKASEANLIVRAISAEQLNPPMILKRIQRPVAQFQFNDPDFGSIFLYIESNICNYLIDKCIGSYEALGSAKELTEIEKSILFTCINADASKLLGDAALSDLILSGSPVPYFDQSVIDSAVFVFFDIDIGFDQNKTGRIFLAVPARLVKELLRKADRSRPAPRIEKIKYLNTEKITFNLVSDLGSTYISAKDLYDMEAGDVIVLDNSIYNLINISIGGHLNLFGQPAIKDNKISLQLMRSGTSRVEKIRESVVEQEKPPAEEMSVQESGQAADENAEAFGGLIAEQESSADEDFSDGGNTAY
ncbi:MAG: FliM/FliN family flagellar motor switch protein [Candidatus Saganbacteria bacterium]|nr:FliM/FliN family flagellar motor switch protein [Candidatus Saganbacteria bacterium]